MKLNSAMIGLTLVAGAASAWGQSPARDTAATIAGKSISVKYSAPSVRGRNVFGEDGPIRKDSTYPVWRLGANNATELETAGELTIGSLKLPAGKYSLFIQLDPGAWKLIVNKQTGQEGLDYDKAQDLGRVPMKMSKPASLVEMMKISLAAAGGNKGTLSVEWENVAASVEFTVK